MARKRSRATGLKSSRRKDRKPEPFPIVGIGASAGGFESISALLRSLPPDTGMSFVVLLHLGSRMPSALAQLLVKTTSMPVAEIADGTPVEPNHVHVLPPGYDVVLANRMLRLRRRPASERIHMPIDHFFQSLAEQEHERAIGVVLSGTGSDGTLGLRAIKAENGLSFAEADATAKYFAMPQSAILAGCVDAVRSPEVLAKELAAISRHPYVRQPAGETEPILKGFPEGADSLTKIFYLLRQHCSVNFADYKHSTLRRRIARRMVLRHLEKLEDYVTVLRKEPRELEQLFNDLLINVTSFFRDTAAFSVLQKKILPGLIKPKLPHGEFRVWVPGCATGEEVYSVAISVVEALGREGNGVRIQIFGTDLSEQIISRARAGIFPETISRDVSPARLRRFFTRTSNGHYQIRRTIRDMCTFARQNVCEDPPFSHIDLITCRNVLIYLGPLLQKKCMPIFHYALNPGGCLMLGVSETVGGFADLFALIDKKTKIYARKTGVFRPPLEFNSKNFTMKIDSPKLSQSMAEDRELASELQKQVDRLILARYAPAGVVVDERMQVVQFRGATSRYLEHAPGAASLNLLQMARPMLMVDLRTALHHAMKENIAVRRENLPLKNDGASRSVHVEVTPLRDDGSGERLFFVTFHDAGFAVPEASSVEAKGRGKKIQPPMRKLEMERLQEELSSTKESLQAIIQEREAANEELKSANEEIQSSNEELQSTNEELETAKEELQSANEELTTVNEEMANRNAELAMLNNDLNNLLSSINIPIIIVDNDLCIRRVTSPGEKVFNLIPSDVGRPLSNIKPNLDVPDLGPLIREVIDTLTIREREISDSNGRWHQLRIRPYRTADNKIDGAVITLVEIDQMKRNITELKSVVDFAHAILDSARDPGLVLDDDLRVKQTNQAFRNRFKITKADLENARIQKIGDHWRIPKLGRWLDESVLKGRRAAELDLAHKFPTIGPVRLHFRAQRLEANGHHLIVLTITEPAPAAQTE